MTTQLHNQLIPNVALDLPLDAVEIGKISMAFGIKGQFKVFIYQDGEALLHTKQWYMQPVNQQKVYCLNITQAKRQAKYIIGATDIFNNPEIVEQFKHAKIFVEKDALPELEDDEHYWQNLINCMVYNQDNTLLGRVDELLESPAHTILSIEQFTGQPKHLQLLIPFIDVYVMSVDEDAKKIDVNWIF